MKGGRKNLKKAAEEHTITLEDAQRIMQVVSLRGSNLIEVMDAKGEKSLALFPAKFNKSFWIKRGNFVVVDVSGKEKALESGCKVACIVSQVLFYDQVRTLQKSPKWPEIFKSSASKNLSSMDKNNQQQDENESASSDDDDGVPPLEANMNRIKPPFLQSDAESNSESESDS